MAAGYICVRYTDMMLRNFGDISEIFGAVNARWMSWKVFGTFLIFGGFMLAFDLYNLFIQRVLFLFGVGGD